MYVTLSVLAAFLMLYSVVGGRVERTWVSGPMLFVAFGLIIGPHGLGVIGGETEAETLSVLAELTLALVLFTDAAGTDLGVLRRFKRLPMRLLMFGLPLTILLGFGTGRVLFGDMTIYEVGLLATMLAPTDAALGKAVVSNQAVPNPIRQGLNVESGLNDGICVPILLLFLTLAQGTGGDESVVETGLTLLLQVVGIGAVVGAVFAALSAPLLRFAQRREWLSSTWVKMTVVALAFTCFGVAQALGGSGFIASFVGGIVFGGLMRPHHEPLLNAAEGIGDSFALLTWVLFGAMAVGLAFTEFDPMAVLYAILSLTVIRMLPVFLVLLGMGAETEGKLFIGWFGPRGLASIVFAVMVMDANLEHGNTLVLTVVWTVILSVLAHGVSANAWARGFGRRNPDTTEDAPS